MLAVNYTELRNNMKKCMDQVTDEYETLVITRKENRNVVMISEAAYNNLLENVHLLGNEANYRWLMESKHQLEAGNAQAHDLTEIPEGE